MLRITGIRHKLLGHRLVIGSTYHRDGMLHRVVRCKDCPLSIEQHVSKVWGVWLPEIRSSYDWDIILGYLLIFLIVFIAGVVGMK